MKLHFSTNQVAVEVTRLKLPEPAEIRVSLPRLLLFMAPMRVQSWRSRLPINRSTESGSILIVTLCSMMIIGLALLTYLTLGKNQNQLVFRSQVWNACLPIAEAGMEDALNHCAWNYTNWVSNGWALSATNSYYRSNTLGDGWYLVHISTNSSSSNQVTITSIGYYPMPGSPSYVPRTVQVKAFKVPAYRFAMMSKHAIDFNGNGCRIDSYDSRDSTKSTLGLYDSAKAG